MLLDDQALFSDQQALTVTAVSQNFINLGVPGTPPAAPAPVKQDIGGARQIPVLVQVTEDFAGGTSLVAELQKSTTDDFAAFEVVASSGAVPVADLIAGKQLPIPVVPIGADAQYLRMAYTIDGTMTAGRITAGVSAGNQSNG